jgi:hypothetical protein
VVLGSQADEFSLPAEKGRKKSINSRRTSEPDPPTDVYEEISKAVGANIVGDSPALEAFIKGPKRQKAKKNMSKLGSEPKVAKGRPKKILNQELSFVPVIRDMNALKSERNWSNETPVLVVPVPESVKADPKPKNRRVRKPKPKPDAKKLTEENPNEPDSSNPKESTSIGKPLEPDSNSNVEVKPKPKRRAKKPKLDTEIKEKGMEMEPPKKVKPVRTYKPRSRKVKDIVKPNYAAEVMDSNSCPEILRFDPSDPLGLKIVPPAANISGNDEPSLSLSRTVEVAESKWPSARLTLVGEAPTKSGQNHGETLEACSDKDTICPKDVSSSVVNASNISEVTCQTRKSTRRNRCVKIAPKFRVPTGGGTIKEPICKTYIAKSVCTVPLYFAFCMFLDMAEVTPSTSMVDEIEIEISCQ